jgi:hypothetical protein
MALKTDDCDIRDVRMFMEAGGNGDFYINLLQYDDVGLKRINYRMAMSGGYAPHEVRMAFVALYRAMESAGLNTHPKDDNP